MKRSFLKWAGGKFQLLPRILPLLPTNRRLIEPFAGSGVVWLNAGNRECLVADANPDLINVYTTLKEYGEEFIRYSKSLFTYGNDPEGDYYRKRLRFNATRDPVEAAALFVYLNRHGFNGLTRYRRATQTDRGFNVPWGKYKAPYFPIDEMRAFLAEAPRAQFLCADFALTMNRARSGNAVIYADPPYVPLSPTANFTAYRGGGFGLADQQRLVDVATRRADRGVAVIISNADVPLSRQLYTRAGATLQRFTARRSISCTGDRSRAGEFLAIF